MRLRGILTIAAALGVAGVAVFLANDWLQRQADEQRRLAQPAPPPMEITRVLVAKTPLAMGHKIRPENVRAVAWPKDALPPGAFSSFDELLGSESERVAIRSMSVNEPIIRDKVSGYGGRASLSALLSPEMRAFTIRTNDVTGVAGFVLPGDRVDVLLTRDPTPDNRDTNPITDLLLQNVRVLGVDQIADENRDQPVVVKAITLEVSVSQAQKLTLSQQVGTLSLSLRNVVDIDEVKARTITVGDLRMGEANIPEKPRAVVRAVDPGWNVRVTRGTETRSVRVTREGAGSVRTDPAAPEVQRPVPAAPPTPRVTPDTPIADAGREPQVASGAPVPLVSGPADGAPAGLR